MLCRDRVIITCCYSYYITKWVDNSLIIEHEIYKTDNYRVINKSTFGTCTTHWPAWISVQEVRWMPFFSRMAKWPWRSRSMPPIINTNWENPKMHIWCKFGDSSSNPLQVIARTSQISYNSKSKWPKWRWRSRSMAAIFNPSREYHRMHVWSNLVILFQSHDEFPRGQIEFPRIFSQNGQMTLKVKVNDPCLCYQPRVSHDACLMQICWFEPKSIIVRRS